MQRFEGTLSAPRRYGDRCNLEVTVDGSTAYSVSTDMTSTWIMQSPLLVNSGTLQEEHVGEQKVLDEGRQARDPDDLSL